jgi:alcohol dehydrogenase
MVFECNLGPSRIVYAQGALDRLGEEVRRVGGRRVLLVTDQGLRRVGHLDRAVAALEAAGVAVVVHDTVEESPTTRHVEAAAAAARRAGVDAFVALGGGSAMDCAKGANFLVTNGGRMEDYWGTGKALLPMLPAVGVPTTAGTGSEAQSYALITQEGSGRKMACGDVKAIFRAVLLDPALPRTAPRGVTAAAGIDAISHVVESYVTKTRSPLSQLYAFEAWKLLEPSFERVLAGPADEEAFGRMLLGAFLAGAAIERSMLGAAHACANPLTARFSITHGAAVALMLPHVVRFNALEVGALYAELDTDGLERRLVELRGVAGLPETLEECSIPKDRLPELAEEASRQWTAGFNPRPVATADLLALYEAAYGAA